METHQSPLRSPAARHTGVVVLVVVLSGHLAALYWPRVDVTGPVASSDKVVHALLFAVPVIVASLAMMGWRWPALLLALHAPVSELVQHLLLPGRSGDPLDIVADLVGVALGVAVARWWASRGGWSEPPRTP